MDDVVVDETIESRASRSIFRNGEARRLCVDGLKLVDPVAAKGQ